MKDHLKTIVNIVMGLSIGSLLMILSIHSLWIPQTTQPIVFIVGGGIVLLSFILLILLIKDIIFD